MKREKICILPSLYDFGGSMDEGKKWYVQFSVKEPRTGQMKRKKVYAGLHTIKNKRQRYLKAEEIIREYSELLKSGWNPYNDDGKNIYTDQLQYKHAAQVYQDKKSQNKTFNYFVNIYMREQLSGLHPNTISTYTSKFRQFEMWLNREGYGLLDVSALSPKVIISFFSYLNNEKQLSSVSYRKYKALLFSCFEYIYDVGSIYFNPVQRVPKCTRVVNKEAKPIHDSDVVVFMERIRENRQLYLFILFEYYCLMRPTEIRMMKISWIDFGRAIIFIPKEISKTNRQKTPIIPEEFLEILKNDFRLHLMNKHYYVIGKQNGEPGPEHLGKNTMRTRFNKIRGELKMPVDYMLYSWKHTANVRLEKQSVPIFERMMQNGHSSIVTTEGYTRNKSGFQSDELRYNYPKV